MQAGASRAAHTHSKCIAIVDQAGSLQDKCVLVCSSASICKLTTSPKPSGTPGSKGGLLRRSMLGMDDVMSEHVGMRTAGLVRQSAPVYARLRFWSGSSREEHAHAGIHQLQLLLALRRQRTASAHRTGAVGAAATARHSASKRHDIRSATGHVHGDNKCASLGVVGVVWGARACGQGAPRAPPFLLPQRFTARRSHLRLLSAPKRCHNMFRFIPPKKRRARERLLSSLRLGFV